MQWVILNPSGNITALVVTDSLPENKKAIAKNILQNDPTIEQVWFLSPESKILVMAWWEFCANAARAATWQLLAGKPWSTSLVVSWYNGTVHGSILDDGRVRIELGKGFCLSIDATTIGLVHLQGISHLVIPMDRIWSSENLKNMAQVYLQQFGLLSHPAAGVMFVYKTHTSTSLYPIVWVRDLQTFIFESACGSGTIAYALFNYQLSKLCSVSVLQPSWSVLYVELCDTKIRLCGDVSFVGKL